MKTIGSIIVILAATLAVAPAVADEGAGGPVPGYGPGGAGATSDAPVVADAEPRPATHGEAMALYHHHLFKAKPAGAPSSR